MLFAWFATMLAVAVLIVSCGESTDSRSLATYESSVARASEEYASGVAALSREYGALVDFEGPQREYFASLRALISQYVSDLRSMTSPTEIRGDHEALLNTADELQREVAQIEADIGTTSTPGEDIAFAIQFRAKLDDMAASCTTLEASLGKTLRCESFP